MAKCLLYKTETRTPLICFATLPGAFQTKTLLARHCPRISIRSSSAASRSPPFCFRFPEKAAGKRGIYGFQGVWVGTTIRLRWKKRIEKELRRLILQIFCSHFAKTDEWNDVFSSAKIFFNLKYWWMFQTKYVCCTFLNFLFPPSPPSFSLPLSLLITFDLKVRKDWALKRQARK